MKNVPFLFIALIVFVVMSGCQTNNKRVSLNNEENKLCLKLSTNRDTYSSGEDIEATLELISEYDESVLVNKRMVINMEPVIGSLGEVYFKITDTDGKEADFVVRVNVRFPDEEDFVYLKPGELISQTYSLSEWYNIPRKPGEYSLQAIYQNYGDPNDDDEAWKGSLTSNIVVITIEP